MIIESNIIEKGDAVFTNSSDGQIAGHGMWLSDLNTVYGETNNRYNYPINQYSEGTFDGAVFVFFEKEEGVANE